MAITHVFKGDSDIYGTFAYMENDELVIGVNIGDRTVYPYRGSIEAFRNDREMLVLAARNRPLLDNIMDYYQLRKHDKKTQEATMNTTEELIKILWKHNKDYLQGRTQDFGQVCKDCLKAADMLYAHNKSYDGGVEFVSEGAQKENMCTKLCEIKVTEGAESFKELVYQLTANGYRVDAAPVYKEFPKTGLDYWMIAIFDKE